jgi:predicted SprT family Zn-dependent metalloprotease
MTLLKAEYISYLYTAYSKMPPFYDNLPKASKIEFQIINDPDAYGYFHNEPLKIQISSGRCQHISTISETLLHEMIHLMLFIQGKSNFDKHDKTFYKYANKISELYGFDPKRF